MCAEQCVSRSFSCCKASLLCRSFDRDAACARMGILLTRISHRVSMRSSGNMLWVCLLLVYLKMSSGWMLKTFRPPRSTPQLSSSSLRMSSPAIPVTPLKAMRKFFPLFSHYRSPFEVACAFQFFLMELGFFTRLCWVAALNVGILLH